MLERRTVLAALAEQTSAVRLGSLLLGNTYQHRTALTVSQLTADG